MKRKVIIGAVIAALLCVCIAMNLKIAHPADYTGVWYRVGDGMRFVFEDGIIVCEEKKSIIQGDEMFSGAYCFSKHKAALFVVDDQGVGEIVELYLIHNPNGDGLYEYKEGKNILMFCRNKDSIK